MESVECSVFNLTERSSSRSVVGLYRSVKFGDLTAIHTVCELEACDFDEVTEIDGDKSEYLQESKGKGESVDWVLRSRVLNYRVVANARRFLGLLYRGLR